MKLSTRLSCFPPWLSIWLGYRSSAPKEQPNYIVCFWSFLGAFCGLAILQAIFGQARYFIDRHVPPVVASYVLYLPLLLSNLKTSLVVSQNTKLIFVRT